jgi:hypothetical protein
MGTPLRFNTERAHRSALVLLFDPASVGAELTGPTLQAPSNYAGFAPFVPHLAYLPLASRQRLDFTGAGFVHFTKCPFASRHGAESAGAEPAISPITDNAMINLGIF